MTLRAGEIFGLAGLIGAGASFASTLGSTWLIRQVERDRSLLPYAVYRLGLAAVILWRLAQRAESDPYTTMAT